jgi:hypothetical protein
VAGEVDERQAARLERRPEGPGALQHRGAAPVLDADHVEIEIAPGRGHQARVVDRVLARRLALGAVADDQRDPLGRDRRGAQRAQSDEEEPAGRPSEARDNAAVAHREA